MTLLRILAPKILQADDLSDILDIIKMPMDRKNFNKDHIKDKIFNENGDSTEDKNSSIYSPDTQKESRTILGSISQFLWRTKKTGGDEVMENLIGCELQDFLSDPDCWDKIIEISYKVWEKEMPDAYIKKLFADYDKNKEESKENRKYQESFAVISSNSLKNPLGSDTETDELDERMNVILDTDLQTEDPTDKEEYKSNNRNSAY